MNGGATAVERPAMAWGPVGILSVLLGAVVAADSNAYGYHRDELYFRLLGERPAWGYVDQPPLTPLLARLMTEVFGDHLWALRIPASLAVVATAILTALFAREVGGRRGAQLLAALGAAGVFPLVFGHVLLTASVDLVVVAAVLLCVARALRGDPRWWLAAGLAVGIGLYNKHLVLLTLVAIGVALAAVGPRRVLASPWLWAGVAVALVVGSPNVIYQITHDWPQLKMAEAIRDDKGAESRVLFVPFQFVAIGLFFAPVWVAGLVRLWRTPALRSLAFAYPVLCVLVLVTGGQPYYTLGLLLALFAAGCPAVVAWAADRRGRRVLLGVGVGLNLVVSAVTALALLPVSVLAKTPIADINQGTSDQIGWPVYVDQISSVYAGLPAVDRSRAVILTANYGEAGALDRFGSGLPAVYSGHNELWYRGRPPDDATVVVAVGFGNPLSALFGSCQVALDLDNGVDIPNEEQDNDVRVCRDPVAPWSTLWPRLQHYS
ncbi:glycosyltransferase family 39 protein [Asanoa sp. WMMD1127]|uniref:glycosyltransferase family 39 protein n=1 Tax=Asanoa sp. WMMD1127 TaxID=3016107 RepID=UPI002417DC50|nr:glycosyltransferase family 39 protein [Asanoa sp. WMMD1127]MDG4824868.1 glycosyltransferase family 39 protein [Asanoa sp. WMMD1127]